AVRVPCTYPTTHYLDNYKVRSKNRGAFREMDFVKNKLGVEVQFGKYAFMVYSVISTKTRILFAFCSTPFSIRGCATASTGGLKADVLTKVLQSPIDGRV